MRYGEEQYKNKLRRYQPICVTRKVP